MKLYSDHGVIVVQYTQQGYISERVIDLYGGKHLLVREGTLDGMKPAFTRFQKEGWTITEEAYGDALRELVGKENPVDLKYEDASDHR